MTTDARDTKLVTDDTLNDFSGAASPFLLADEALNNLQLGVLRFLQQPGSVLAAFMATVRDRRGVVNGVALQNHGHGLLVSGTAPSSTEALVIALQARALNPPGVFGPPELREGVCRALVRSSRSGSETHRPARCLRAQGVAEVGTSRRAVRASLARSAPSGRRMDRRVSRPGAEHRPTSVGRTLGDPAPKGRHVRVEDHLELLGGHADYLASIASRLDRMTRWKRDRLANPRFVAIVERFHLTHALNYAHLEWGDVAELDQRLASIGTVLCVTTAAPDELRARLASRGPAWGEFLSERGQRGHLPATASPIERADYFVAQQAALRELAARTAMTRVEIDTGTLGPEAAAGRVLDLLFAEPI